MIQVSILALVVATAAVSTEPPVEYEPDWASLETHPTPEWFEDAKFGIFIHWGVYSVPSFCDTSTYSEWYQHWLNTDSHGGKVTKFHAENYGEDFKYREFAPMFRAEMWDPAEWASIFKRSGAEYIVITSKHHDGFCLWPSDVASEVRGYPWDSVQTGPQRDLLGELFEACRDEGVRPGLYYSFMEWESPLYSKSDKSEYVDTLMIPQIKDLIERYQPAVFWPDGEWDHPDTMWKSPEILEWIYENAANPEEIVVNDRWGRGLRGQVGDYTTTEYDNLGNSSGKGMRKTRPFEECRGVGHSFAFNRAENYDIYDSRTVCVQRLIDLVSRGGVLLLDIGPTADGRIPLIMVDRLLAIGDWLAVNGEAIKGTRRSPFRDLPWGRATVKGDDLYLHVFDWPADDRLEVPGLISSVARATMLGDRQAGRVLAVEDSDGPGVVIDLAGLHPFEHATVIKLELDGPPKVDDSIQADASGSFLLPATAATVEGPSLRVESYPDSTGATISNLGYWTDTAATANWTVNLTPGVDYEVEFDFAVKGGAEGGRFELRCGDAVLEIRIAESTGGWNSFEPISVGRISIPASSGDAAVPVSLRAVDIPGEAAGNLRTLTLRPVSKTR
ncbi:MAG: alpha-L-fucosidase [Phycisphaerales bacterium]|nr:alpha-L-fucosidase [Phycisphaerales bacterium]